LFVSTTTLILHCLSASLSIHFFFHSYANHRDLHSFPTRRSSDLRRRETGLLDFERTLFKRLFGSVGTTNQWSGLDVPDPAPFRQDRKSTRLNSSHGSISYAVFCLKKKNKQNNTNTSNNITPPQHQ